MREDYLHYLWQYQKLEHQALRTANGLAVKVISPGSHNLLSGPDFFNARLLIGDQEWAGNLEIHLRSSDWYMHGHENDPAYDNVILHVVWEHDVEVYRRDNSPLPVVEIKKLVLPEAVVAYDELCSGNSSRWINCENDLGEVDDFLVRNWLERLYLERLEQKTTLVNTLLGKSAGDWEAVLFQLLAKNFGLNVNGEAFLSIAASIPFAVIRKVRTDPFQLEALLLGQAGLLTLHNEDAYYLQLKTEYNFLCQKFKLSQKGVLPVKYFRLRPDNFPEIRLVQLAAVYHKNAALFSALRHISEAQTVYELFDVQLNDFWNTHYTFRSGHSFRRKKLSKKFLDLLIINTIVPLNFTYIKSLGGEMDQLLGVIAALAPEENQIINKFRTLRPGCAETALESQALLQLKNEYCDKNACLRCAVGLKILQKEPQI
ncbi:DUF2851 family protein [Salinimicrobium oceani]|uniref:DUF2851 family protein n=1 Tax=Salinimicrobium oceani TaxID=2722702 RepID=A0ABX1CU22_9FLAO|nr:DUF2851 family protein [Salinimicrobium oceani]NJW51762.1 DUF2851 family protein [Salinimicrobium oceani]